MFCIVVDVTGGGGKELKKRSDKEFFCKVWFDVKNIALAAHHEKYNDMMKKTLETSVFNGSSF